MLVACVVTTSLQLDAWQGMVDVDQLALDALPYIKKGTQDFMFKLQNLLDE